MRSAFAAVTHFCVSKRRTMSYCDQKIGAHKKMCFPEIYMIGSIHLGSSQYNKNSISISFYFRTLVCIVRIFHGKIVQAKLLLHLAQQRLIRFMQTYPYKMILLLQYGIDIF